MGHGPAVKLGKDNASAKKTKLGLILFAGYCVIYAGFVAINIISPKMMGEIVFSGLNLAMVYGFALIFIAIIMGLIYNQICTNWENKMNTEEDGGVE